MKLVFFYQVRRAQKCAREEGGSEFDTCKFSFAKVIFRMRSDMDSLYRRSVVKDIRSGGVLKFEHGPI